MSSFLHLLAIDLINKYPDFKNVTVVFPNKRAGLFLAAELARFIDQPVWMPEITNITEFIEKQTGLKKAEELILITKLYKAYTKVAGAEEKFEDFYFWGNMLLNDFDDIDKHLIDAKAIFSNLVSLKEVELSFPYLSPEQIEVVKTFWSSFNPDKYSKEQQDFLNIWDKLYATYTEFKKRLFAEKLCYEGMGLRYFFEHIEETENTRSIVFAGFNALNNCEKQIFTHFRNNKQACFYWDYDIYYSANEFHEAGRFIRENMKLFPNELGPEHFNNFKYNDKKLEFISVPSDVGQAKLIPALTEALEEKENIKTAIVLCDERMLLPVMHSVPSHIRKINITMGYPAQNTSVAAFIYLLGELKKYTKNEKEDIYYYYKPVIALLNHKLIKDLCPKDIDRITNYIHQKNIVYIPGKSLQFNPVTEAIFSSYEGNASDYVLRILRLLAQSFDEEKELLHPVEKEFIFILYTHLQCLQNTFEEENIHPDDSLYMQIITKVINTTNIPFSGEPLEGLQLMGLLETRLLDFSNLIILSANEGILPSNRNMSSFIPYNLRAGFKLPTPEYQDALYAYNFYRLLQRAKNVKVLYTTAIQGIYSGEMSRFLYQIKYESGLPIKESNFQNHIFVQDPLPIEISKNQPILTSLSDLGNSEEKPLSPSALNNYLDCPVKFYFKYIADIKEKEEIAEELDHRLLGNIFHESSESLYSTVAEHTITPEIIDSLLNNRTLIDEHIQTSYLHFYDSRTSRLISSGSNELILEIIRKYIRKMLEYDKKQCPFDIISMEKKYSFPLDIRIGDCPRTVYIGGIIDRVDQTKEAIRIIDYKTGSDTTTFKDIPSIFNRENPSRNKAAFQTMLYCLMFGHKHPEEVPLVPGIYSTKLLFAPDYDHRLKCDKDYILNFERYREEFLENLRGLLQELFSDSAFFTQTSIDKKCHSCQYSCICRK